MSESTSLLLEWMALLLATNLFSFGLGATIAMGGFNPGELMGAMSWGHWVPIGVGLAFAGAWVWLLFGRTFKAMGSSATR